MATVSGGVVKDFNAGATIVQGKSVYLDGNSLWQLAQSDSAAHLGAGNRTGVSISSALNGQPLAVQETGVIVPGATLAVGTLYVISAGAAGGIAPITDLATTNKIHILGIAKSTTQLDMAYKTAYANGYTALTVP